MKILVTGGAGYIGSACAEYLLDLGYEVAVIDSLATGHKSAVDKRALFIRGDLADRDFTIKTLKEIKVSGIMHFAAFSLVGESMTDPGKYFRNNLAAGINLLDAAVTSGVENFVFSSTCATYGEPRQIPITEKEKQKPINPYGESKLMFEKALRWYSKIYGIKYSALRYFNAAGASANFGEDHRPETHLVPIVLQTALGKRKSITIFGDDYPTNDGTCVRDYIHILDLAQAHELALHSKENAAYNLGTGNGYSVKEIIQAARKITGKKIEILTDKRRHGDPPILIGSSELAKKKLGWRPMFENIEAIIESAWKWALKFPNGYHG
jgi:UDP-glucose 4-epimerase